MARAHGAVNLAGVATGTSKKTLLQLVAAANHAIELTEIGIGFHGTSNTAEPIKVTLERQTDAGTMSAATPVKQNNSDADSLDSTAQHTATVEPTATDVLRTWTIHPQTGLVWQASDKSPIIIGAGDRVGLIVTAAASVNADCYMAFEE